MFVSVQQTEQEKNVQKKNKKQNQHVDLNILEPW